jgi:predicted RNase H-like HicB family nuclease
MHEATYELLEGGTFYGEIPACKGIWSNAIALKLAAKNCKIP